MSKRKNQRKKRLNNVCLPDKKLERLIIIIGLISGIMGAGAAYGALKTDVKNLKSNRTEDTTAILKKIDEVSHHFSEELTDIKDAQGEQKTIIDTVLFRTHDINIRLKRLEQK